MAINLSTQRSMRGVMALPFCYLCGQPLKGAAQNRDHVPPTSLFLPTDRDHPLILPTHQSCNGARSKEDQMIGSLVGILHGKAPSSKAAPLPLRKTTSPKGDDFAVLAGLDLRGPIRRWITGFHAALYREYLPDDPGWFMTTAPAPEFDPDTGSVVRRDVVPEFVSTIKKNRLTKSLDSIVTRNKKCVYECVWAQADTGQWLCIFALDIYGWVSMGDNVHFPGQGCVGAYRLKQGGTPRGAAEATRLEFRIENQEPLDPFGA